VWYDKHETSLFFKYDATFPGGHGTGGEYVNQIGFGWTNGVIMELLDKYGQLLTVEDDVFTTKPGTQHTPPYTKSASSSFVAHVISLTAISTALLFV
jgi:alpha,alpha-trehalase